MRYGERGMRYVHMEVGHVGENVYLQARSMGLDTVAIGAFHDDEVSKVLKLPEKHKPLYLMPVGYSF
jgi:SagB-type dehydrogenase family enzyme